MNPNDPTTVAAVVGAFSLGITIAYAGCFGVVALVDHFRRVAR